MENNPLSAPILRMLVSQGIIIVTRHPENIHLIDETVTQLIAPGWYSIVRVKDIPAIRAIIEMLQKG